MLETGRNVPLSQIRDRSLFDDANAAEKDQDFRRALDLYSEVAAGAEIPPADICVKAARCCDRLDDLDAAFTWLTRATDSSDAFVHWSSAASLLARLTKRQRPAARRHSRAVLAGSYTTSQLAAMLPLAALRVGVDVEVHEGFYDQYQQDLINPASDLHRFKPEQVIVAVHEGAARLPAYSDDPQREVAAEVARWVSLWDAARRHSGADVIQHNFAIRPEAPLGHLSAGLASFRYAMLQDLNHRLAGAAAQANVSLVDCDLLSSTYGRGAWFDDRYWFRAKQAVALEALPLLARHTAAVMAARAGLARKCLVLDLDNTIWGGVIGEDGLNGIKLGGDAEGEAFVAFQEEILTLKHRGVILAVASKNNEADAREVFERHPEMRIRLDDIAMFAVNWEDKPANLRRIAATLDIGLDALVLADDNPAERQIVRRLVPEVEVLSLPTEPALYRRALAEYLGFESPAITAEDRSRTVQYRARAAAAELASTATDINGFYRDLRMRATVAPFDEANLTRIVQLIGKTNQFNVTTRRHRLEQVRELIASPSHITRYLKLSDRFTDHGLVALAIAEQSGPIIEIDTFLMSCRVIGRTVEEQLLVELSTEAANRGCTTIRGTYIPTNKNAIVRDLYERLGFTLASQSDDGVTVWNYDLVTQGPITNEFIEVER